MVVNGDYQLGELADYVDGIVVAHVDSATCFAPSYDWRDILQIEIPYSCYRR